VCASQRRSLVQERRARRSTVLRHVRFGDAVPSAGPLQLGTADRHSAKSALRRLLFDIPTAPEPTTALATRRIPSSDCGFVAPRSRRMSGCRHPAGTRNDDGGARMLAELSRRVRVKAQVDWKRAEQISGTVTP
jgi:hypothetical protein